MKIFKILLISACTMLISSVLYGQTGVITGRVSDLNGEGLYGTNVVVKGTAIGVITDFDGNYSIQNVPVGQQTVEFNHSDLNAGVYFYKITLNGLTKYYTVTKSMVVVK